MNPINVANAADTLSARSDNLIHLSSGVVLEGKQANPIALIAVMSQFPMPKPPMVFMESIGRNMENAQDPDYIERVRAWEQERAGNMLNAMILYGTSVKSVPDGFPKPEENDWLDELSAIGVQLRPQSKSWRYISWVTFKAVQGQDDLAEIKRVVGALSGVREADVKAAETFPGSNETNR